eukprot:scaffold10818_cov40-Prasinocladus_malaysianus.AAC.1
MYGGSRPRTGKVPGKMTGRPPVLVLVPQNYALTIIKETQQLGNGQVIRAEEADELTQAGRPSRQ